MYSLNQTTPMYLKRELFSNCICHVRPNEWVCDPIVSPKSFVDIERTLGYRFSRWVSVGYRHRFKLNIVPGIHNDTEKEQSDDDTDQNVKDDSQPNVKQAISKTLLFASKTDKEAQQWTKTLARWAVLRHYLYTCQQFVLAPDVRIVLNGASENPDRCLICKGEEYEQGPAYLWAIVSVAASYPSSSFLTLLQRIDLVYMGFTDSEAEALGILLELNPNLKHLDLSRNHFTVCVWTG